MTCKKFVLPLALLLSISCFAQETKTPVATERQKNQQKRIGKGVKNGQLTAKETAALEKEQKKIQADKKAAKADGTVTPEERAQIQKEQNKASKKIYREKHDAQAQPGTKPKSK